jgi:hypothetical protein
MSLPPLPMQRPMLPILGHYWLEKLLSLLALLLLPPASLP